MLKTNRECKAEMDKMTVNEKIMLMQKSHHLSKEDVEWWDKTGNSYGIPGLRFFIANRGKKE